MLVNLFLVRAVEGNLIPGPHPGHQLDAQEVRQTKDRLRLSLGIGMDGIRLNVGFILEQAINDVDRFPDTTGNEVAEKSNVGVRDVVIGNAAITPLTHMSFRQQAVFAQLKLRPIGDDRFASPPEKR